MDNGSVLILYKYVDGAHFFIGGDKMSDGVCVANADIYVAYHEVTAQLAILAKENFYLAYPVITHTHYMYMQAKGRRRRTFNSRHVFNIGGRNGMKRHRLSD